MSEDIENIREVYSKWKNELEKIQDYDEAVPEPLIREFLKDLRDAVKENLGIDLD